jgi:CRISPR-associated protein Csb2
MIALSVRFIAGRYHATPWGRHVNEGAVEWPLSPWRILRALIAVWHRKFAKEIPESSVRPLIERLTELPVFHLPKASLGHTRHFMPQRHPLGTDKTKVFDAFVSVSPEDRIIVAWPDVTLSQEERRVLTRLALGIGYLGRAESWVAVEVWEHWDGRVNVGPIDSGEVIEGECVRVLAAQTPEMFAAWKERFMAQAVGMGARSSPKRRRLSVERSLVPHDLWNALHAETSDLQAQGWSSAPGSRWVDYVRPEDAFRVTYQRKTRVQHIRPTVARFALSSAVLPRLTDALFIGERMRQALMAKSRGLNGTEHALPVFSGKGADGLPLDDDHAHAFYLPSDEDLDGRIDHITVYASQGFDKYAEQALGAVKRLWGSSGHDIHTVLIGLGQPQDYGGLDACKGQSAALAQSRIWQSTTPYLLTRHLKKNGKDSPHDQVRRDLRWRGLPEPEVIQALMQTDIGGKKVRWLEFRRMRISGGGRLADPRGFGFRITFAVPVQGPFALGYACHFGLGQFVAVEEYRLR